MSDETRRLYVENGRNPDMLDMAYEQSVPTHDSWLAIWWGSENDFAEAPN